MKVTKAQAMQAHDNLIRTWAHETGVEVDRGDHPSFSQYVAWLEAKGYGYLMRFRSVMSASDDVERLFDRILRQTWRN